MIKIRLTLFMFIVTFIFLSHSKITTAQEPVQLSNLIQQRIQSNVGEANIFCRNTQLCRLPVLWEFYKQRNFKPAWIDNNGISPYVTSFIALIQESSLEGLRPDDYDLKTIRRLINGIEIEIYEQKNMSDLENLVNLDLLLTDAFLMYASHLLNGRVNPETIHAEWFVYSQKADIVQLLKTALESQNPEALKRIRPPHSGYESLRKALILYKDIETQGGWPQIPCGFKLRKNDTGLRVRILRHRLAVSGDIDFFTEGEFDIFDNSLKKAVRKFQRRHGLKVDGIVGSNTLTALNIPVKKRIQQIQLNMERWRWLPHDLGKRYLLVNIANFELQIIEKEQAVMTTRAVVGSDYRRTPVFSGKIKYVVFNPYWHIPPKIAIEEILPRVKNDPSYLFKKNITIFQGWQADSPEIHPALIDWNNVTDERFIYKFRQEAGPLNPLGRMKFIFPNKFDIYIHDTPEREIFTMLKRGFSHGCIRIEHPIDLAEYLLQNAPDWTRKIIDEVIEVGARKVVQLPEPVPVHILYWTCWIDNEGLINFRDDIYGRDEPLANALLEEPPNT